MKANDLQGSNPSTLVNMQQICTERKAERHPISPPAAAPIPVGSRLTNRCLMSLYRRRNILRKQKRQKTEGKKKKKITNSHKAHSSLTRSPVLFLCPYCTEKKDRLTEINEGC